MNKIPNPRAAVQKTETSNKSKASLSEIFRFFTRLGIIGFGGPPAHIALMQDEAQEKRGWLTKQEFADGLAVCNLLPGPASTQMTVYIGWLRRGVVGGLTAGVGFIWPAFTMMLILSWFYFSFGTLPQLAAFFYGLKPVVVGIILATTYRLAKPLLGDWRFWLVMLVSCSLFITRWVNDFFVFLGAALFGGLLYILTTPKMNKDTPAGGLRKPAPLENSTPESPNPQPPPQRRSAILHPATLILLSGGLLENSGDVAHLLQLGWFFMRVGALIFGGGLVIIPFIQSEIVDANGWLTTQQFTDGVALGQATPGPVLVTATFVGYGVAGLSGAVVATIGIFAPGFLFILLAAPFLQKVKQFPYTRSILNGVNGAVVGSLLAAAWFTALTAIILPKPAGSGIEITSGKIFDPYTFILAVIGLIAILRYKVNTIYLFVVAGGFGLLISLLPFRLPLSGL